jgi:hypothetical protein
VCGAAVESDCFAVVVDVEPELGGYQDVVADWLQRFADKFLVDVGAVPFGGVEQGDAAFGGGPNDGKCFCPVAGPRPKLRPMQPRPIADVSRPSPSLRVFISNFP